MTNEGTRTAYRLATDTPNARGAPREAPVWENGLPAPRWCRYNDTRLAIAQFRRRVLGEYPQ